MRRIILGPIRLLVILLPLTLAACAGLDSKTLGGLIQGDGGPLDEETVAAGLKEALRVGTERTVGVTSRTDGFFGNALIRIVMPEQLQSMAKTLRTVGFGGQVDEFEVAMNRAAERAAGEATGIFWQAITRMSLSDAFGILNGGETAATDYFHVRTADPLRQKFRPIVTEKMTEVGLYRIYEDIAEQYNSLPLGSKPLIDLEEYVTERALGGLFTVLGQEEKRIREDPAARTTALLRKVFDRSQ